MQKDHAESKNNIRSNYLNINTTDQLKVRNITDKKRYDANLAGASLYDDMAALTDGASLLRECFGRPCVSLGFELMIVIRHDRSLQQPDERVKMRRE